MRTRVGTTLFATAIAASAVGHALLVATFPAVRVGSADPPAKLLEVMVVLAPREEEAVPELPEFEMGRLGGTGAGSHDLKGRREQVAREAPQDQPPLSLDPVGRSLVIEEPSAPAALPGFAARAPPAAPPPIPHVTAGPLVGQVRDRVAEWVPPPIPMPLVAAAPAPTPAVAAAPSPGRGADPAPQSDSEVDAFSILGSARFRDGRVSVRAGRQVKTRRPKIGLAGMVDLAQQTAAQVVLKVAVDATGKVTDVDVVKSSGSNEIDQPCRVAVYEWWFEPKKDAAGRAVPDVFRFTISFR